MYKGKISPGTQRRFWQRMAALALSLLLLASLCGCSNGPSFLQTTTAYQYFYPLTLDVTGTYPTQLPAISNLPNSDEINLNIAKWLQPVFGVLTAANEQGVVAYMDYSLQQEGDVNLLQPSVCGVDGGRLLLPAVALAYSGSVTLPDMPDLSYLRDSDFAADYLCLIGTGMQPDPYTVNEDASSAEMYRMMCDFYAALSGREADISVFPADSTLSDDHKRAVVLGLCGAEEYFFSDSDFCSSSQMVYAAHSLYKYVARDCFGYAPQTISLERLMDTVQLFLESYIPDTSAETSWSEVCQTISTTDLKGIYSSNITRQAAIDAFVRAYENAFGLLEYNEITSSYIVDTFDGDALKAFEGGLVNNFPSNGLMSTEYVLHASDMSDLAFDFADTCFFTWCSQSFSNSSDDVTLRDIMHLLANIRRQFADFTEQSSTTAVINDRSYSWYVCQYYTGKYSSVNCMPSISEMAIKWYCGEDCTATAANLRERYLPEYNEGWYMDQVTGSLDAYAVPYRQINDTSIEAIVTELDKGNIVLSQMSEAEFGISGHCFVIYGYRRTGDAITFLIHDPGVYDGTDEYGKEPGKAMELDSEYAHWIIERIAYYIISVGDGQLTSASDISVGQDF